MLLVDAVQAAQVIDAVPLESQLLRPLLDHRLTEIFDREPFGQCFQPGTFANLVHPFIPLVGRAHRLGIGKRHLRETDQVKVGRRPVGLRLGVGILAAERIEELVPDIVAAGEVGGIVGSQHAAVLVVDGRNHQLLAQVVIVIGVAEIVVHAHHLIARLVIQEFHHLAAVLTQ